MTVGVTVNPAAGANAIDEAIERARAAERAGLASVWSGQLFSYDAVGVAGLIGRAVPGINVGTSAVPIFGRHPILLATQAQTTQAATGGRYTLGVALGAKDFVEPVFGVPYERPIRRLREFLTALRAVFDDGGVELRGETLTAVSPMSTRLAGATPTPVLVAAMGPQALRVTGELADGTLPFLAGPRALGEHIVPAITAAAEAAGRPRPRVVALVPAVVTADVEATRERATAELAFYDTIPSYQRVVGLSGVSRAAELAAIGDEELVAATVRRYFDAGATEVVLSYTDLGGAADEDRTWRLGGALARG